MFHLFHLFNFYRCWSTTTLYYFPFAHFLIRYFISNWGVYSVCNIVCIYAGYSTEDAYYHIFFLLFLVVYTSQKASLKIRTCHHLYAAWRPGKMQVSTNSPTPSSFNNNDEVELNSKLYQLCSPNFQHSILKIVYISSLFFSLTF